jgi:hypothetical protein
MIEVWTAFIGLAIVLWLYLRWTFTRVIRNWRGVVEATLEEQAADEWANTRRGHWHARWELIEMQRVAYEDVARPLEPYVAIFVLFSAPVSSQRPPTYPTHNPVFGRHPRLTDAPHATRAGCAHVHIVVLE